MRKLMPKSVPHEAPLIYYEELQGTVANMKNTRLHRDRTLKEAKMQTGDVVCFHIAATPELQAEIRRRLRPVITPRIASPATPSRAHAQPGDAVGARASPAKRKTPSSSLSPVSRVREDGEPRMEKDGISEPIRHLSIHSPRKHTMAHTDSDMMASPSKQAKKQQQQTAISPEPVSTPKRARVSSPGAPGSDSKQPRVVTEIPITGPDSDSNSPSSPRLPTPVLSPSRVRSRSRSRSRSPRATNQLAPLSAIHVAPLSSPLTPASPASPATPSPAPVPSVIRPSLQPPLFFDVKQYIEYLTHRIAVVFRCKRLCKLLCDGSVVATVEKDPAAIQVCVCVSLCLLYHNLVRSDDIDTVLKVSFFFRTRTKSH